MMHGQANIIFSIRLRGLQSKFYLFFYVQKLPSRWRVNMHKILNKLLFFIVNFGYDAKCNYTDDSALPISLY